MKNKYEYIGGADLNGRMFAYESEMKKNNLSSKAIKDFAIAIKNGNLNALVDEFKELSKQQKSGLLNLFIDYNDLLGNGMDLSARLGYPIKLAEKFKHKHIVEFLELEQKKLSSYTKGATTGLMKDLFPQEIGFRVADLLETQDALTIAQTCKIASQRAVEEELNASNIGFNKI